MGNKLHRDKLVFRQDNSIKRYLETKWRKSGHLLGSLEPMFLDSDDESLS